MKFERILNSDYFRVPVGLVIGVLALLTAQIISYKFFNTPIPKDTITATYSQSSFKLTYTGAVDFIPLPKENISGFLKDNHSRAVGILVSDAGEYTLVVRKNVEK